MKTKLFSNILVVLFAIITISWSAYPQIVEGSDIVEQESIPYSDLSTHDTLSYNEKQPAYGLQPPLQMSDLPDESDAGTQLMEEAPVQDSNIGTPLQMFNTENPEEDNSDAVHSANDIYETGHTEEIDTEEIDTEEIDTEEIDTEEIDTEEIDTEEIDT